MVRIIVIVIIAALGWCFYTGKIDLSNFKENSIEKLKNEKTIKAINSSRDRNQQDVDRVNNGDF